MKLKDFNYDLPTELIAQTPSKIRDESRLMVNGQQISHKKFQDIIDYFEPGDVLVLNETRVKPSVFYGKKTSGADARIVLVKKIENKKYLCRVKSRCPKVGNELVFDDFKCTLVSSEQGLFTVVFDIEPDLSKGKLLYPDYVKEKQIDEERYQTVFNNKSGSLAAPTAGLHFTKDLLNKIEQKGVKIAKVCLHVSFGTFLPIYDIHTHKMEEEYFEVSDESAELINNAKRLFVCGTTALKCLESCDWIDSNIVSTKGFSNLFIYPGYNFKSKINGFITNFHLPKSTLLLLVSAYYGKDRILNLYKDAIKEKYRFYSFGDSMLLLK